MNIGEWAVWAGHTFSVTAIIGAIVGWFPPVAVALAIIWYSIQIFESATVRNWATTHRALRIAKLTRKIERLAAEDKIRSAAITARRKLEDTAYAVAAKKIEVISKDITNKNALEPADHA